MALNQPFLLQNSGPNSTLKLKMALRVGVSVCYQKIMSHVCVHSALVSVCFIHIDMFLCKQVLCLEKEVTSSQPSSVRVRHSSQNNSCMTTPPQTATSTSNPTVIQPSQNPSCTLAPDTPLGKRGSDGAPVRLAEAGRSISSLEISSSHKHQSHRDSTPSLASDISLPSATLELQQRLQQLQK